MPRRTPSHPSGTRCARGWHAEDIRAAIRKRYGSLRALSIQFGLNHTAVSSVLRRPEASLKVERLIAAAIGETPHALWPDRWDAAGKPLPRIGLGKSAPQSAPQHSQKREAA